ncbi:putative DDE Tnp4 domain-containing protein, partial [Phytophthora infestans]
DPNGLAKLAPPPCLCQKMNNQATPPDDDLEPVAQIMALIAAYHGSPYYWKEASPLGLFDLGDAGYGLTNEVLISYRGVRHHLCEWGQLYNLRHAQARNVNELAFETVKSRFRVLLTPSEFRVSTQA